MTAMAMEPPGICSRGFSEGGRAPQGVIVLLRPASSFAKGYGAGGFRPLSLITKMTV